MKVIGICGKSIEDLRELVPDQTYEILTVPTFMKMDLDKRSKVILVDNIAKLCALWDINIIDAEYYDSCWRLKDIDYKDIANYFSKEEDREELIWQFRIVPDFDLGDFEFITHLNEFNAGAIEFCKKLHNLLSRTKKETINCSEYYKEKLRALINKQMSDLYIDYRNKKAKDVPEIFKYIKYMIETDYAERDKKELEKEAGKSESSE